MTIYKPSSRHASLNPQLVLHARPSEVLVSPCLYGCYVHSSIIPTFHRRCYWLLQVNISFLMLFSVRVRVYGYVWARAGPCVSVVRYY
ncbi:hypothetical protein AOLI_G00163250 [Acnodon oligacanthus]